MRLAVRLRVVIMLALIFTVQQTGAGQGGKIIKRVKFDPGSSSAALKGAINKGREVVYVLGARKGQRLEASIDGKSEANDVVFSITGPDGKSLMGREGDDYDTKWSGVLPKTGDYQLTVGTIESITAQYTLKVSIR